MLKKVLIANRGEIALRVLRACKEMGLKTVAVYSTADKDSMPVKLADGAVCIGPPPPTKSYLDIPAVISAAEVAGVDAIHPGYGFLAENENFAERAEKSGFTFIGPSPQTIEIMGNKVSAIKKPASYRSFCISFLTEPILPSCFARSRIPKTPIGRNPKAFAVAPPSASSIMILGILHSRARAIAAASP